MLAERAYFGFCLVLGRLLRGGRYSRVRIIDRNGELAVRKRRAFYAPPLVALGGLVVRVLDTGMRVLHQAEWEARERLLYRSLYGMTVEVDADRTLILPYLPGDTLANILDDQALGDLAHHRAIELAATALAEFHSRGFTHGDAMAENVLVDLDAGVARWFDFETVHEPSRSAAWCRADDMRALLATSVLRTATDELDATLARILHAYGDQKVTPLVAESFASAFQRPLAFHLGQAGLSFPLFRDIGRLLRR